MSLFLKPCKTVLASLALVAGMFLMQGAPAVYAAETQTSATVPELTPAEIDARKKLHDIVRETRDAFFAAMKEGRIKPEELELLDFTQPDEEGYGDNVAFEVFNPKSPRSIVMGKSEGRLIPQEILDELTTSKDAKVVFNLRRLGDGRYEMDEIKVVIPQIKSSVCAYYDYLFIKSTPRVVNALSIVNKDNHEVIFDGDSFSNCSLSLDNKLFLLDMIAVRHRAQDHQQWSIGAPPNPYDDSANPF